MRVYHSPCLTDQNSSHGCPGPLGMPLLWGSREATSPVMEQIKTSLFQGVVLEELKLCQTRAVPSWQSQFALIGQTSDLPHPFTSSQVPQTFLLLWCLLMVTATPALVWGAPHGRPYLWVPKEVS